MQATKWHLDSHLPWSRSTSLGHSWPISTCFSVTVTSSGQILASHLVGMCETLARPQPPYPRQWAMNQM